MATVVSSKDSFARQVSRIKQNFFKLSGKAIYNVKGCQ